MGFFTQIGENYKVLGDVNAWDNYSPATAGDPHSRGESTGTPLFSLKGKTLTITAHVFRTEEGYPQNQGDPYSAYEIVKVSINGETAQYYAWVVYDGVVQVEKMEEQQQEPTPPIPPIPDDPIEPTNATEVRVLAGQTTVLEVNTTGPSEEEQEESEKGSIEVKLVDEEGKPYQDISLVYLIGETAIYTVQIDNKTGIGVRHNVISGEYDLQLQLESFYFDPKVDTLHADEMNRLGDLSKKLNASKLDFDNLKCVGCSAHTGSKVSSDNLRLKRALHIKKLLSSTQNSIDPSKISTGIMDLTITETSDWKENEKVDLHIGKVSDLKKEDVSGHEPPIPQSEKCFLQGNDFGSTNLNVLLGNDTPIDAKPRLEKGDTYYNSSSNYKAHLPVSYLKDCFLVMTNKVNIYQKGESKANSYHKSFIAKTAPTFIGFKDERINIESLDNPRKIYEFTISEINEEDLDHKELNLGRRIVWLLYSVFSKDGKKTNEPLTKKELVRREEVDIHTDSEGLSSIEVITEQKLRIHFSTGKYTIESLSAQYKNYLQSIVKHIEKHEAITSIELIGHTDSHASESFNLELSKKRTESIHKEIMRSMILKNRIDTDKLNIVLQGKSENEPIKQGFDPASMAYNRRVEIILKWDYSLLESIN